MSSLFLDFDQNRLKLRVLRKIFGLDVIYVILVDFYQANLKILQYWITSVVK